MKIVCLFFLVLLISYSLCSSSGYDFNEDPFKEEITKKVYFKITINGKKAGKIVIGLFGKATPRTAENFRALCTGENGMGTFGYKLTYKRSKIHRIQSNYIIQGGDIYYGNGQGGESIYGKFFDDENFKLKHTGIGVVSMNNKNQPHTNGSQFNILLKAAEWMDDKNVVFGRVIENIELLEKLRTYGNLYEEGFPSADIRIYDSGEVEEDDE